jgi:hypothetical protein
MAFRPELYPPDWQAVRQEKLKQANHRCQSCGVQDRSIRENTKNGSPYIVYLSIAHKNQYETWKEDAETMVLCQRCHRRYDRQFRRRSGVRHHTPVGYASIYTEHRGRRVLVEMTRTLDELRDVVAALPSGSEIEIQLIVILAVVGNGHYTKQEDGSLSLVAEYGACSGLLPLL